MEQKHYIEFQKTRDFGALIGDTFEFIVKNIRPLVKNVLIIMIPIFLMFFLWVGLFGMNYFKLYTDNINSLPAYFWIMFIINMILGTIFMVLLICINYDYIMLYIERKGESIPFRDLWSMVKKDFFRVFLNLIGLIIVLSLFLIIVSVVIGLVTAVIGVVVSKIFAGVMIFLFILIAGTYFMVVLWPVFFIIVYEKKHIFSAVLRSFQLISGKWWFTFGLLVVMMLVWSVFLIIPSIPYYILVFTFTMHGVESMSSTIFPMLLIITYIILSFIVSLMYMIPLITIALHYFNLRERKEASSLFDKLDKIELNQ
jgi:hypothetical protein